ncbi:glycosyltransferase family 4 protein [Vibrio sp. K4]|uniref:glycosyltransferase family 4 protein n=1 Tax=Vibrio sp. K4 TaxID=3391579 RepID=UPI003DA776EC
MKILFVCNEYPPYPAGGIGVFTKELAESLSGQCEVYVVGLYNVDEITKESINGVNIVRIPGRKSGLFNKLLDRIKLYRNVTQIIDERKVDIVECQDFNGFFAFFPKIKTKLIVRLHGSVSYFYKELKQSGFKSMLWRLIEKNHLLKADHIVSVSDYTAYTTNELFRLKSQKFSTIYNGVKVDNLYRKVDSLEVKKYIFAGSIIKKKGICELIDAWIIFSKGKDNVTLDVYGKDIEGLSDVLIKKLESVGVNNCTFHSPLTKEKLVHQICNSSFFISPTKAEAFSLAPLEAMACSTLVLYSNQTSAKELIKHSENGILIPSSNVEDIIESLEISYSLDVDTYNEMTLNAYNDIVGKFNVEDKCIENIDFYQSIVDVK